MPDPAQPEAVMAIVGNVPIEKASVFHFCDMCAFLRPDRSSVASPGFCVIVSVGVSVGVNVWVGVPVIVGPGKVSEGVNVGKGEATTAVAVNVGSGEAVTVGVAVGFFAYSTAAKPPQ